MTVYGYMIVPMDKVDSKVYIISKIEELKSLGVVEEKNIFFEYQSESKVERVEYEKMLSVIKVGDTIVSTEVTKIVRNNKEYANLIELVKDKKLILVLRGFTIDCSKDI